MAKSILDAPYFHDEEEARKYLEAIRWPSGPFCPHCGNVEKVYALAGESHRPGLYKCSACRKQFTVTVGTLFERSKVPLHKWLTAVYLMCASKKSMSSHQLHRMMGVTYKTAWFMTHRIREAMKDPMFTRQLGGAARIVEADETFWGNTKRKRGTPGRGYHHKEKIFSLVERGGDVRSFHVPSVSAKTLKPIMQEQIAQDTAIVTDEMSSYNGTEKMFRSHDTVTHGAGEYVRGQIHTNTIENYFSLVKRALVGTYHHVAPRHLRRYIGEFDFRYNNRKVDDSARMNAALCGIDGKRLMYRDSATRALHNR